MQQIEQPNVMMYTYTAYLKNRFSDLDFGIQQQQHSDNIERKLPVCMDINKNHAGNSWSGS